MNVSESAPIRKGYNQIFRYINMPITQTCTRCGTPYETKASHAKRRRFCSHKCQYEAKTERALERRKCPVCKNEFKVSRYKDPKYCSKTCAQRGMAETKRDWSKWYKNP